MAKTNGPFIIDELYESLGIFDLPALEQQQLDNFIANWRVQYQTEDGRLGSDLVDYQDAEADLGVMAQKFLEYIRNGPGYWQDDKQNVRYDERADEIRRLLGQVFCQKNLDAVRNARKFQIEGEKRRSSNIAPVAPMLPVAPDVAVSDATHSQDQSGGISSDDPSYCESAVSDNSYDTPRRSNRKRTPSKKRQKVVHPQGKPSKTCNRCKQHHSKCDGAQRCIRCTKAGKPCVYSTPASSAGSKAKEDVTMHSAQLGSEAGPASLVSSSAPAEAATAIPSPADSRTDAPAPRPTVTIEPDSIRSPSSDWQRELVPQLENNTVEDVTHQRGGTDTGDKDQTTKPNVKITFMVITEDRRGKTINRCWHNGSLSGKSIGEVFHEAEALVGRVGTEQIDFELEGSNTIFPIAAGDEESFECMRDNFNTKTKEERKKGCWKFKILLTLEGGIDLGDHKVDNQVDEQGDFEDIL